MGRIFSALLFSLIHHIQDTQCGFKLFRKNRTLPLFQKQTLNGFAFDVEILHAAQQNHYKIQEVPINWYNIPGSKVHLLWDSWWMFLSLFKITCKSLQGYYKITQPPLTSKASIVS
jgi:hypothetical protein